MSVILKYGGKHVYDYGAALDFGDFGGPHQPNERLSCDVLVQYTKEIASYILKTLG
jgi:hypothetical protein